MDHADVLMAVKANDEAAIRRILSERPGVIHAPLPGGLPLLQMAIYARATHVVEALLAAGARMSIHEAAAMGRSAVVHAEAARDPATVTSSGPDGMMPLHLAAHFGHVDTLEVLLALGAQPNAVGGLPLQNTALHAAIAGNQRATAEALLRAGARLDIPDGNGNLPIAVAKALCASGDALRAALEAAQVSRKS